MSAGVLLRMRDDFLFTFGDCFDDVIMTSLTTGDVGEADDEVEVDDTRAAAAVQFVNGMLDLRAA